jgi:hypothetical protein
VSSDLELLTIFSEEILKTKSSLVWRPTTKIKEFWANHKDFLQTCYNALLLSNLTSQFAQAIIMFLQKVLMIHEFLLPIGLGMLQRSSEDFYVQLNKDVRKQFAEFTVAVIKATHQFDIAIRDLKRLDQGKIWDIGTFLPYSHLLVENMKVIEVGQLLEVYHRLVMNSTDLAVFKVATLARTLFGQENEQVLRWFTHCLLLAEDEFAKVTPDIQAADAARINERLESVKGFLAGTPVKLRCEVLLERAIITLSESQEPEVEKLANTLKDLIHAQ